MEETFKLQLEDVEGQIQLLKRTEEMLKDQLVTHQSREQEMRERLQQKDEELARLSRQLEDIVAERNSEEEIIRR
jgi:chromosome segregation ATPase